MGNRQRRRRSPRTKEQARQLSQAVARLDQRLIGFLDILGFQRRMLSEPLDALHKKFAALIDQAASEAFGAPQMNAKRTRKENFDYAAFHSDSIVLVSGPIVGAGAGGRAFDFMAACSQLLHLGFAREMPLRGCISVGNVLYDARRRILLSEAIPGLLDLEKDQEWAGCVIAPGAEAQVTELVGVDAIPFRGSLLIRYAPPLKSSAGPERLCLNWLSLMSNAELAAGLAFLQDPKLARTKQFIDHVAALPSNRFPANPGTAIAAYVIQKAKYGVHVMFLNAADERTDPPYGFVVVGGVDSPFGVHVLTEPLKPGTLTVRLVTEPPGDEHPAT